MPLDDSTKNIHYENREIVGERLMLTAKDAIYWVGPNVTLRRCTLVLRVAARWLHIYKARLIDCVVEVKQELKNFSWTAAELKGCRFTGRMMGCSLGHWPDSGLGWEYGAVEDCDFSAARLDACAFHGCDPRALKFPPWPCFTILDPIGRRKELDSVEWPGIFGDVVVKDFHNCPPSIVALTFHAPLTAKQLDTTPEALKAVIEKFDFILY